MFSEHTNRILQQFLGQDIKLLIVASYHGDTRDSHTVMSSPDVRNEVGVLVSTNFRE